MFSKIRHFLEDDRGQSTTEYILILAVVVMVAVKFRSAYSSNMGKLIESVLNQMNSAVAGDS
jgi:Flp pilus assembly pilin Flp